MRNLLLIAYEFPPSAGGGVQRLTKFARYLPESGWLPTVLCAEPAWGRPTDPSLLSQVEGIDVVRLPARNVSANIARVLAPIKRIRRGGSSTGAAPQVASAALVNADATASRRAPLSTRLMRRYWIDPAEPWSRAVPAAAARLHAEHHFEAVLASGPPPSALMAAARCAEELGIPLLADFRDAWADNPNFRRPERPALDRRLLAGEREVLRVASAAIAVSQPIAEEVVEYGAREVLVVPNGFDSSELPRHAPTDGPLKIAFMGRFYGTTDPTAFLDGLALAVKEGPECVDVRVDVVGPPSSAVEHAVADRGLQSHVAFHGFRPHAEALAMVASADVGLVVLAEDEASAAIYTGKLFEYLGVGIPVLLVGPSEGVAARLIDESHGGRVVGSDPAAIAGALAELAARKVAGQPLARVDEAVLTRFERRSQAAEVARVLDRISDGDAGV